MTKERDVRSYRLARIGEKYDAVSGKAAVLYDPLLSSFKDLDEFGIGIALYFRQLIFLFIMLSACALVSLSTIRNNLDFNGDDNDIPFYLKGSALGASRADLSFKNQGLTDVIVCALLVVFAIVAKVAEDRAIEVIDVSQQTAQDYSVCITNPPVVREIIAPTWLPSCN